MSENGKYLLHEFVTTECPISFHCVCVCVRATFPPLQFLNGCVTTAFMRCICFSSCFMSACVLCPRSEEEDREVAAAMRASLAMHRQEERAAAQERNAPKHSREERMERMERTERMERMERTEPEEPRHRTGQIKPTSKPPGEKESYS